MLTRAVAVLGVLACCLSWLPARPGYCQANSSAPPGTSALPPIVRPVPSQPPLPGSEALSDAPSHLELDGELDLDSLLALQFATIGGSLPDMMGDSFISSGTLTCLQGAGQFGTVHICTSTNVPPGGGGRTTKISENNKALPSRRVYVNYHHFHNALGFAAVGETASGPASATQSESVDRWTLGWEHTLCCDQASVELRLPIYGNLDFDQSFGATDNALTQIRVGTFGNLGVILKRLLYRGEKRAVAAGLGIEIPTAPDVVSRTSFSRFIVRNEAVHVSPFIGMLQFGERTFLHAFGQMDLVTNGNGVRFEDVAGVLPARDVGRFDDQTLLFLDVAGGYWLCRGRDGSVTQAAAIAELHYTTPLKDTDVVAQPATFTHNYLNYRNEANRFDVVNLTTAIHLQFSSGTQLRIGSVLPLRSGDDRFFDAELFVQLNRPY